MQMQIPFDINQVATAANFIILAPKTQQKYTFMNEF